MLEARITQGSLLKKVFDAIKEMVPEVNLDCTSSGIHIQAMDTSHVSLVSLDLKDTAFENYICDRDVTLGLNMGVLAKVFKMCGNDDIVTIRHEDNEDFVTFVYEAATENRVSSFTLNLHKLDTDNLGIPEQSIASFVSLPSKQFQRICADLSQFADSVSIKSSDKTLTFSAKGDAVDGTVTLRPSESENEKIEIRTEGAVFSVFALRYLNYFAKGTPLSTQVNLEMSPDAPLQVTFELHDDPNIGHLRFYLAPKIEADDPDEMRTQEN